jgi:shikimate dehydrogenase
MTDRTEGTLLFVGVSTSASSIMTLFPRWASALGLQATIEGRDLPVGAARELHRRVVIEIASSDRIAGALVTTHKVGVFEHAAPLFDELDSLARLCREVSCISKRNGRLVGHAKDPITAGLALEHILDHGFWERDERQVLGRGAGGAGTAITVHLLSRGLAAKRIVVVDRDPGRVGSLEAVCREMGVAGVRVVLTEERRDVGRLVGEAGRGSLIINATGMGKDLPGSPLPDDPPFPPEALVWDLNYRGDLRFLRQAQRRRDELRLRIHDGWKYFLHGWSEVIAEVYGVRIGNDLFGRLEGLAEPLRPPLDTARS